MILADPGRAGRNRIPDKRQEGGGVSPGPATDADAVWAAPAIPATPGAGLAQQSPAHDGAGKAVLPPHASAGPTTTRAGCAADREKNSVRCYNTHIRVHIVGVLVEAAQKVELPFCEQSAFSADGIWFISAAFLEIYNIYQLIHDVHAG